MEGIDYRNYNWLEEEKDGSVIIDANPYQMKLFTLCAIRCKHYNGFDGNAPVCSAFPKGIPPDIWLERVSHKKPYIGDHGIQFVPNKTEK